MEGSEQKSSSDVSKSGVKSQEKSVAFEEKPAEPSSMKSADDVSSASGSRPASASQQPPASPSKVPQQKSSLDSDRAPAGQKSGSKLAGEARRRSSSGQAKEEAKAAVDKSLAGASSGPSVPQQGGAGGPEMMAKMMEMMSKSEAPGGSGMKAGSGATPGGMPDMMSMMGKGGMPDMMSMMGKGGMPDMMAMMGKGGMPDMMSMMGKGGMPDMMAMMGKGGMPDMMAMMGKGGMPDMKAMMGKGGGGPMGMANLFDCIIEVSLAKLDDSDVSDDDDESIPIEIPCPHCARIFTSQMSLKTHILVAHDHVDSSVLNLKKLVIEGKGKHGLKDQYGSRRKKSRDSEKLAAVDAAGSNAKAPLASQESSAAESGRGLKRSRSGSKPADSQPVETSGAAGEESNADVALRPTAVLPGSGAGPSSDATGSPPETRKRKAQLRSVPSQSGETSALATRKKSKPGSAKPDLDSPVDKMPCQDNAATVTAGQAVSDGKTESSPKDSSKHKKIKTVTKEVSPAPQGKRTLRKAKDSVGGETESKSDTHLDRSVASSAPGRKGRQSTPSAAACESTQRKESPSASRRSLRNRKSH